MSYSAYMVWYGRITRRLIGPPVHIPPIGFQPMGSIVEILEHTLVQIHQITQEGLDDGTDASYRQALQAVHSLCSTTLEAVREDHRLHRTVHTVPPHLPHTALRAPLDVPTRPHGIVIPRQRAPRYRHDIQLDASVTTVPESSVAEPTSVRIGPQHPPTPSVVGAETPSSSSPHQQVLHQHPHTSGHSPPLTDTSIPYEGPAGHVSLMAGPGTYTSDASGVTLPNHPMYDDALMTSPPIDVHMSQTTDEVTEGDDIGLLSTPAVVHRSQHRATTPLAQLISLVRGRGRGRG